MSGIIFLDRDGTIIKDQNYLSSPDQVELLPGAGESLNNLSRAGFKFIVISNQSGIGRGYFDHKSVELANLKLNNLLSTFNVKIEKFYYCPHSPDDSKPICNCRKPLIGLFEEAQKEFSFVKADSWMIGDKFSDIEFGMNAGLKTIKLGSKKIEYKESPDFICQSLQEAAKIILNEMAF